MPLPVTRSRSIGAPAIVTGLVVLVTMTCLANGARRVGQPFPGFLVAENRTVLSVARSGWSLEKASRTLFAQVVAVEGRPVTRAEEIQGAIASLAEGTPVAYRLRKGSDVFSATVEVQRFSLGDFVGLYGMYALVGLFFALSGLLALHREQATRTLRPAVLAFFLVCQSAALTLGTAGDVYGPYWFTSLYFTSQCLVVASVLHLAASFPQALGVGTRWRRLALFVAYGAMLALATALLVTRADPSIFLPLVYALYLLLANAIFLYAARLAIGLSLPTTPGVRSSLRRALAGVALVVVLPLMIFLVYPARDQTVSPLALVGPFALFPLLTVSALARLRAEPAEPRAMSLRLRLSLLFLGAVETSFLIAVAVFWQNSTRAQLLDARTLNQRQTDLVERVLTSQGPPTARNLRALDDLAQTVAEVELVNDSAAGAEKGDVAAARRGLERLGATYADVAERLARRQRWLESLDAIVLGGLLAIAVIQAVAFMLAVRRWLIGPIESIAAATQVIATGDLAHRIDLQASDEFQALAGSVNAMAASLQRINRRVEAARGARLRAAGAARDAERRRLARELHDGILQDLSVIRLRLEAAAVGATRAGGGEGSAVGALAEVIAAIRRVVDDLRPSGLGELSLEQAIAGHARILAFAHGVELSLDLSGSATVPDWAIRDVYRIAQEATANALRHAAPRRLTVRLVHATGATTLEVEDDGCGFELDGVALGGGIRGMRERAAALGADLEISTRPGGGSRVRVSLRDPSFAS